jgi:hypothetical protein
VPSWARPAGPRPGRSSAGQLALRNVPACHRTHAVPPSSSSLKAQFSWWQPPALCVVLDSGGDEARCRLGRSGQGWWQHGRRDDSGSGGAGCRHAQRRRRRCRGSGGHRGRVGRTVASKVADLGTAVAGLGPTRYRDGRRAVSRKVAGAIATATYAISTERMRMLC